METIVVEPLGCGWAVKTDVTANDMIFRSGQDAEASARALAKRLARQGEAVRLKLRLRNSDLSVRMICLPALAEAEPVRLITLPDVAPIPDPGPGSAAGDARTEVRLCHDQPS